MSGYRPTEGIVCSWCGTPVRPGGARMRLFQSETIRVSGNTLAHFHVGCGDALLDLCEGRTAGGQKAAAE